MLENFYNRDDSTKPPSWMRKLARRKTATDHVTPKTKSHDAAQLDEAEPFQENNTKEQIKENLQAKVDIKGAVDEITVAICCFQRKIDEIKKIDGLMDFESVYETKTDEWKVVAECLQRILGRLWLCIAAGIVLCFLLYNVCLTIMYYI